MLYLYVLTQPKPHAAPEQAGSEHNIRSLEELVSLVGEPVAAVRSKPIDHLDHHCRDFISRSPFLLLGTADATGRCDVSPRGGPAVGSNSSTTTDSCFPTRRGTG